MRKLVFKRSKNNGTTLRHGVSYALLLAMSGLLLIGVIASVVIINAYQSHVKEQHNGQFNVLNNLLVEHTNSINDALFSISENVNSKIIAAQFQIGASKKKSVYTEKLRDIMKQTVHSNRVFFDMNMIIPDVNHVIGSRYVGSLADFSDQNLFVDFNRVFNQAKDTNYKQPILLTLYYRDGFSQITLNEHIYMPNSYYAFVLSVSRNVFDAKIAGVLADTEIIVYLFTEESGIYGSYDNSGNKFALHTLLSIEADTAGIVYLQEGKFSVYRAKVSGISMLVLFKENIIASAFARYSLFFAIFFAILLITVALLRFRLRKSFVYPVYSILNRFENDETGRLEEDEYRRIETVFEGMRSDIDSMEQKIRESESKLRLNSIELLDDFLLRQSQEPEWKDLAYFAFRLVIEDAEGRMLHAACHEFLKKMHPFFRIHLFQSDMQIISGIAFCVSDEFSDSVLSSALIAAKPQGGFARMGMSDHYTDTSLLPIVFEDCRCAFESPDYGDAERHVIRYQPSIRTEPMSFAVTLKQQSILASSLALGEESEVIACLDVIVEDNKGLNLYWMRRLYGYLMDLLIVFSCNQGAENMLGIDMNLPWSTSYNLALLKSRVYAYYQKLASLPVGDSLLNRQIRDYVEKNLSQEITIADIAQHVDRSYSYVSTQFSETYGMNFSTYMLSRRMRKAKELLSETDLSVSEIALECGYNALSSFIRTFKKVNGLPPGAYRDMTCKKSESCCKDTGKV